MLHQLPRNFSDAAEAAFAEAAQRTIEVHPVTITETRLPAGASVNSAVALPGPGGIVSEIECSSRSLHVRTLLGMGMQINAQEGYEDA